MTDTIDTTSEATAPATPESTDQGSAKPAKKTGGLNTMLLADLRDLAAGAGVANAKAMKKADLIAAIKSAQKDSRSQQDTKNPQPAQDTGSSGGDATAEVPQQDTAPQVRQRQRGQRGAQDNSDGTQQSPDATDRVAQADREGTDAVSSDTPSDGGATQDGGSTPNEAEGEGGRRNRRRRGRDRAANRPVGTPGNRNEPDTTILEDDVLVPAAGILDVLDNYAFVRTSGYLPGTEDVYLSLSMVRKYGLRRGDAVVGQVRQPREGERKEKFNPMVRVDNVNGAEPEAAKNRADFTTATPVHPSQRLRLETEPGDVVGRVVDLVAPIGKGQRGLIVAPPRSGKTTLLQTIAAAISRNHPECHLMVVLVDERPEEVTEFQRTVKGEVIASTFDRPPADHTILAELAIDRAKRLVELGHDVVVLLDGLTRLGRAYNLSAGAGGRALPAGVDAGSLYPPKRFFGAARSLEDAGSLTILATAQIGTGSATDELLLEEFSDAANWELRLTEAPEDRSIFPAVDVAESGTRREERLVSDQELAILTRLRQSVAGRSAHEALTELQKRVRSTSTNIELLRQV